MDLTGKVAIVTGASRGIGRATALALANQGVKQVATARSAERLEKLAKELPGESLVVHADMTDPNTSGHWCNVLSSTLGAWIF
jgi:NADP-dependent 3-hydroxy acid dehydrogenase YdfG